MIIKEINYGTGNRVGDTIYINKDLKRYTGLYEAVLAHEMKHTGNFKWKDFTLDLMSTDIKPVKEDWWKFLWNHPKAWINFFPVMRLGGEWTFDISIFFIWVLMTVLIIFGWLMI